MPSAASARRQVIGRSTATSDDPANSATPRVRHNEPGGSEKVREFREVQNRFKGFGPLDLPTWTSRMVHEQMYNASLASESFLAPSAHEVGQDMRARPSSTRGGATRTSNTPSPIRRGRPRLDHLPLQILPTASATSGSSPCAPMRSAFVKFMSSCTAATVRWLR
jgi:hypothetical protein